MQQLNEFAIVISPRLFSTSLHIAAIVVIVLALQFALGRRLSANWRCVLWSAVLLRLLLPGWAQTRWSIMNLLPERAPETVIPPRITVTYGQSAPLATQSSARHSLGFSPRASTAPHRSIPWNLVLVTLWALGFIWFLGRLLLIDARLRRLLRLLPDATDPRLLDALTRACERARVAPPRVAESVHATSPAITGLFKPTLIVPKHITSWLDEDKLNLVLLHEMMHLRRADLLWRWIAALVVAIQWFNPMVWLAWRRFLADCELACDEAVLKSADSSVRRNYGDALLTVAEWSTQPALAGAVGILGRSSLPDRIRAAVQPAKRWALAGPIALLIAGCSTMSAKSPAPGKIAHDPSDMVAAVYDIRDVTVPINDYKPDPDSGFSLTGKPISNAPPNNAPAKPNPEPAKSDQKITADLINFIQDSVAPSTWKSRGGSIGTIDEANGQLVVYQTRTNQDLVAQILARLRESRTQQILIQARFLAGEPITKKVAGLIGAANATTPEMTFLDEAQTADLLRSMQSDQKSSTITAPRIILFNGQRAFIVVSTSRAYVASVKEVIADGAKGFEPEIRNVESGVRLECQATAAADKKSVTVTLHPQLANLLTLDKKRVPDQPDDSPVAFIQVPNVELAEFESTVQIPEKKTLAALMRSKTTDGKAGPPRVLLVTATLITPPPPADPAP